MNRSVSIIFFIIIIAVLGGSVFLWYQSRGLDGLSVALAMPQEALVGVPFDVKIQVENGAESVLEKAELIIEAPDGISFVGSGSEKRTVIIPLGTLGSGSVTEESVTLIAVAGEQTVKEIKVELNYVPARIGSRFEKKVSGVISVLGSAASIDLELPQQVFGGEEFTITSVYRNLADLDLEDVRLTMEYPPAFSFVSASSNPDSGNAVWELGDIKRGNDDEILIKGKLIGPDGAFFSVKAKLEIMFEGHRYLLAEKSAPIAIATSPLSLTLTVNNQENVIAHLGQDLEYKIRFVNTTTIGMRDVVIRAKLSGEMFDFTTLTTSAALSSFNNMLLWNAGNTNGLALIPPGSSGEVTFRIRVKPNYTIKRLSDKDFIVAVNAEIESPTVPPDVASDKTITIASLETKVAGKITGDAQGFFRDAPSGFVNGGTLPPKVNKATQYTIHWKLTNYGTDVGNVVVKAFVGGNVKVTSNVKSTTGTLPVYNANTQEIIWEVGSLVAGKGIVGAPAEAIFQIEATPSSNDIGKGMILLQETRITAVDAFTEEILVATDGPVITTTLDDPTVNQQAGTVIQ
ncbi:MAG: hypothetical protein AAB407_04090 [Patescibacteria group bacterium]